MKRTLATSNEFFGLGRVAFDELTKNPVDVTSLPPNGYFERAIEASLIGISSINAIRNFINKTICSIDTGI